MKRLFFLMILPLLVVFTFGTSEVSAQVRIGANTVPHAAAVMDLNVDDSDNPSIIGGLALPRVSLTKTDMQLNNANPINGMQVYNTTATLDGVGVYVWMTDKWVKTATGSVTHAGSESIKLNGTSFERAELTGDVTAGLNSNITSISNGAVTSDKIAPNTIVAANLNSMGASEGQVLTFRSNSWTPSYPNNNF
ncbi:MAG: hypothetical protein LBC48_06740, partial [Dysgonamonadaceae bacterium]|nr:hypothetical protein [Dysgonamonadaceae bacterium]